MLNSAGLQSPPVKNGLLRQFIVATGSDGYSAVFALGELAPQFGGGGPQNLVAYQADPPLGASGFAKIVAPKDDFGGRYVANLSSLQIGTAPAVASSGGGTTMRFRLSGAVKHPGDYELATLQALPATTETVAYSAVGQPVTATFTEVSIWALLTEAGLLTDPAAKNDVLNYYLLATGSDGYQAILSLGELDPMFGGAGSPDLIAYMEDGAPLGSDGFARIVVPGDQAGGRYVSNLVSLQVIRAVVPEPGRWRWSCGARSGWRCCDLCGGCDPSACVRAARLRAPSLSAKLAGWRGSPCVSTLLPGTRSATAKSVSSKPFAITARFRPPGVPWACRTGGPGC